MWKRLGFGASKAFEFCNVVFGREDWEEKNTERKVDFNDMTEISEENSNSIRCHDQAIHVIKCSRNMVSFWLCAENLNEVEFIEVVNWFAWQKKF